MKKKVIYTTILVAGLTFLTFNTLQVSAQTAAPRTEAKEVAQYTCAHHPEVVSDKPGKCPKCGMDLSATKKHEGMKEDKMKVKKDNSKMKNTSKDEMKKDEKGIKKDEKGTKKDEKGMKKDTTKMGKMKM